MTRVFSLRALLVTMTVIAVIVAATIQLSRQLNAKICDGYDQQFVVDLLIQFMEENEGNWPKSWDNLESLYKRDNDDMKTDTFEIFKQRIFVDFNADVQKMREVSLASENPAFRVVYAKFTSGFHPFRDPNSTLQNYLREEEGKKVRETSNGSSGNIKRVRPLWETSNGSGKHQTKHQTGQASLIALASRRTYVHGALNRRSAMMIEVDTHRSGETSTRLVMLMVRSTRWVDVARTDERSFALIEH